MKIKLDKLLESGFIIVPKGIIYDNTLSPEAKVIGLCLMDFAYQDIDLLKIPEALNITKEKFDECFEELKTKRYVKSKDTSVKVRFKKFNNKFYKHLSETHAEKVISKEIVQITDPADLNSTYNIVSKYLTINGVQQVSRKELGKLLKNVTEVMLTVDKEDFIKAVEVTKKMEPDSEYPPRWFSRLNVNRILSIYKKETKEQVESFTDFVAKIQKPEEIELYHALKEKLGNVYDNPEAVQKAIKEAFDKFWAGKTKEEVLNECHI